MFHGKIPLTKKESREYTMKGAAEFYEHVEAQISSIQMNRARAARKK